MICILYECACVCLALHFVLVFGDKIAFVVPGLVIVIKFDKLLILLYLKTVLTHTCILAHIHTYSYL